MKPAIWNWINMLRTTQLPQGRGAFKRDGRYCALGILCLANGQPPTTGDGTGNWSYVDEILGHRDTWEVVKWNDRPSLMTFSEIADKVEKTFGALS